MWGEFEDKVDELTMTMVANQVEFNEINGNSFVDHSQGKVGMLLAGARSNLAADRQDVKEKQVVKKELDAQHLDCMTKGKKRISWILGQDMCAIKICAQLLIAQCLDGLDGLRALLIADVMVYKKDTIRPKSLMLRSRSLVPPMTSSCAPMRPLALNSVSLRVPTRSTLAPTV